MSSLSRYNILIDYLGVLIRKKGLQKDVVDNYKHKIDTLKQRLSNSEGRYDKTLYSQNAIDKLFKDDVEKEIISIKNDIQTYIPMPTVKQPVVTDDKKDFAEKTLRYVEIMAEDNEIEPAVATEFKQSYERLINNYNHKEEQFAVDTSIHPESYNEKLFETAIDSQLGKLDTYITPVYDFVEEPVERPVYDFVEELVYDSDKSSEYNQSYNQQPLPTATAAAANPTVAAAAAAANPADRISELVDEAFNINTSTPPWYVNPKSSNRFTPSKLDTIKPHIVKREQRAKERKDESKDIRYARIIYEYVVDSTHTLLKNRNKNNRDNLIEKCDDLIRRTRQIYALLYKKTHGSHPANYKNVQMWKKGGGYTGGGIPIVSSLVTYTASEYTLYIIVILILLYLCFDAFAKKTTLLNNKVPSTKENLQIKSDYTDVQGGRQINII